MSLFNSGDQDLMSLLGEQLVAGLTNKNSLQFNPEDYEDDPMGFLRGVLGVENIWDKLEEIVLSTWYNRKTAVVSANSVGKTFITGQIVIAWLNIFREDTKIITTAAPPIRQIRDLVWGEIRHTQRSALERGIPLVGGEPLLMSIDVNDKWWAKGFSIPQTGTVEDKISKFQGQHAEHMLIVVDEAHGVPAEIYEAIDAMMSGGHNHLLLLSNPLAASGPFFDATTDPTFNTIYVSAFDHPNVKTGREIIPGAISREQTEERIVRWTRPVEIGETEDASCFTVPDCIPAMAGQVRKVMHPYFFTKTLGLFPTQTDDSLYDISLILKAIERWKLYKAGELESPVTAADEARFGLDVAEMGLDFNVYIRRTGALVDGIQKWNGLDTIQTGSKVAQFAKKDETDCGFVDTIGVGAGVAPHLNQLNVQTMGIKVSARPTVETKEQKFTRLRDQLYWALREWLEDTPNAMLPDDPELYQEMSVMKYDIDFRGKIKVTDKPTMKKLIKRSPNALEALILTFYEGKQWKSMGSFVHV